MAEMREFGILSGMSSHPITPKIARIENRSGVRTINPAESERKTSAEIKNTANEICRMFMSLP
ncbi:hypothetical protein D3C81_2018550 [compost metagenome]